jgi:hypothetical protein
VETRGLKPRTSALPGQRSNQLSYVPKCTWQAYHTKPYLRILRKLYRAARNNPANYSTRKGRWTAIYEGWRLTTCYNSCMSRSSSSKTILTNSRLVRLTILTGVIIFAVSGWAWWTKIHNNPTRVFWAMFDNSLSTTSVTTHVNQASQGQTIDRYAVIHFGTQNAARSLQTREQVDGTTTSTVAQETIGTTDADYLRFPYISTGLASASGKPIDYSSVEGVWAKTDAATAGNKAAIQNFDQAVLGTVPFANFSAAERKILVKYIRDDRVYMLDPSKVIKKQLGGKQVYEYTLEVNAKQYFTMLQEFAAQLGVGPVSGLDPSQYDTASPLSVQFTIDVVSRQLVKIHYNDSGQDETFDSYGVRTPITLPASTIPLTALQKRIQSL